MMMRFGFIGRSLPVLVASAFASALAVPVHAQAPSPEPQPASSTPGSVSPQRALLNQYCVTCHNERLRTAGLTLDEADLTNIGGTAPLWEKVVRKLRAGAMPPAGRARPDRATYDELASWLEGQLDQAASAAPHPGRTEALHRLNRTEYANAVRDVLALEIDVNELLPPDDASYGFDNIAGVLGISPSLLEQYLLAARKVVRVALGNPDITPVGETFRLPGELRQDDRFEGLPFGTRGGTALQYNFPLDGEYVIRVQLDRNDNGGLANFPDRHDLELSIDGERVTLFTVDTRDALGLRRGEDADKDWEVRVPVEAGPRDVRVAFIKKTSALQETPRLPFLRPYQGHRLDTRYQPHVGEVLIVGPFDGQRPTNTPSRQRILVCDPATRADEAPCARSILSAVARRAYRRPVTETDLQPLLTFYEDGRTDGDFEAGIELALQAVLSSPDFLFRVERDPAGLPPNTPYQIPDMELASRLSFFLWSSVPDDELIELAQRAELKKPDVLHQQVERMLADARSQALITNFAGQWLYLRNLPATVPHHVRFPNFDVALQQAFRRETELFFESIVRGNRSALELLTARHTFVNERLAKHYGIPNVLGPEFRRVDLPDDSPRGGLLGHGSILTVTAYPTRTSPVLRGKWILENLLGYEPPPPPPDIPSLEETNSTGQVFSMRERMVRHRASPACASCHAVMDPPGLALENFDAVGRWRVLGEGNSPIDATGTLPDGTSFDGPAGLRQAFLRRPETFVSTVTQKLLTYALGRGLEPYDMPTVRQLVRDIEPNNYRLEDLIVGIVDSVPFQMRQSAATPVSAAAAAPANAVR